MPGPPAARIRSLDLIRGVAVLGILAVNIASFAAPHSWGFTPNLPAPGTPADTAAFVATLILFEGKMRALFSMLFGASLLVFVTRRDARGEDGAALQVRRLLWLALFGLLHFALLWDGDILFLYACVGFGALAVRRAPPAALLLLAAGTFTLWQAWGMASWAPTVAREHRVLAGTASAQERWDHAMVLAANRREDAADRAATLGPYRGEVAARLGDHPAYPLALLASNWGETLSYMLLGMVLLGSGFFTGAWPARRLGVMAAATLLPGLALTALFARWAAATGFPELTMRAALGYGLALPHVLMAAGYAALLVLAAPALGRTAPGRWLTAAGQMAFTNYIGCTAAMCALFYGWGAGLFGQIGEAGQAGVVLGAWAVMLAVSTAWLRRFRYGPLEWMWRSLTLWRAEPLRRRWTAPINV